MDFLKKFTEGKESGNTVATEEGGKSTATNMSGHSQGGGLMGKIDGFLGGGAEGEKKEDGLDKTVDWVQEHILGQGPQTNESAVEQAKDEAISDAIRDQFEKLTGKPFPVKDK